MGVSVVSAFRLADAVPPLTPDGEATVARNLSVALQISQETLSNLTVAERMMLMELLQKIC